MKATKCMVYVLCCTGLLFACKNSDDLTLTKLPSSSAVATTSTTGVHEPLTVITIAGKAWENGSTDGPGKQARFSYPNGIDVMDDGTIYVADEFNDKIRKISNSDIVSTVAIPKSSDGESLSSPGRVRIKKDGTINILAFDAYSVPKHKIWIIKPSGEVLTPGLKPENMPAGFSPYHYADLQKDPYNNLLWISGSYNDASKNRGVLEKFYVNNGNIGTSPFFPPVDSLTAEGKNNPSISSFFCGYNGVKYMVINGNYIYKYTSSGVFTRIYRNLAFHGITSIVANRDSLAIYIADDGKIKRIVKNTLQTLVGPQPALNRADGVGSKADVYANQLGLSKDENTLYFTDDNMVRKLLLK
ncbi:hypothetical protein GS399_13870 [Pedobacter sp. HMF7647]|uniref:ScyD/ScyE family protein n=1 Tax=Hufsiella arboris TaxID=2695275 RepID=A0A7K1YBV4_9SPHI|nr:hypothetical protein [Hufsiella arboris]MXV52063.1 hypothetical protein [Hufsiella arboris]